MGDSDVSVTNHAGARKIRMVRVKIKVSGCFRIMRRAKAWRRDSSYLTPMAALGYNHHVAIHIALDGKASDMITLHHDPSEPNKA